MGETARRENLVDAESLRADLADEAADVVVLDVRQTGDGADPAGYASGHIPGAVFVDIDADLAGVSDGTNGRRPLPRPDAFEKTVRRWGIGSATTVVVYGATATPAPARAWWLLRWAGVRSVRLLDGGLDAWVADGGHLQSGSRETARAETDFVIAPGGMPVVEVADVLDFAERGLLLDARPAAKFASAGDPAAGHIPGAKSAPVAAAFDRHGRFKPDDELRELFARNGIGSGGEPAAYCGTGVAAALEVFVLALLDVRARLYVGSVSEWTADPSRPLQR